MSLGKLRIAIPTKGQGGLEDVVSNVFGRANNIEKASMKAGTTVTETIRKTLGWQKSS